MVEQDKKYYLGSNSQWNVSKYIVFTIATLILELEMALYLKPSIFIKIMSIHIFHEISHFVSESLCI